MGRAPRADLGGIGGVGRREQYESLPSTQDRAVLLARQGAPEGTRVVARRQLAGRGRLARSWTSPEGGLYLSMVLARPAEHPGLLPLAVGGHLVEAFRTDYSLPVSLKWPNDLLVRRADGSMGKLSGILTDEVASPTLGRAAVVGVGVNVRLDRRALPSELGDSVAALDEFVRPAPTLDKVEAQVVRAALGAVQDLSRPGGADRSRALCRTYLYGVGRPVRVDGVPAGTIEALGEDGELWLSTPNDRVAVWAGDVRVEGAP